MAKKVHIVFYLTFLSLLLISSQSFSQYGDIRFELLSTGEGLKDGTIYCIYLDSKGFLWIGGGSGLYRYDGYNFKLFHYNPDNQKSLSNNNVYSICEDSAGILWIGTFGGGLDRFNMKTETFTHYIQQPEDTTSLSDNKVIRLLKDRYNNLWIGTYGGGLNKLKQSSRCDSSLKFTRYRHNKDFSSLSGDEIYSLYEDTSGNIWIGTNKGLSRYVMEDDNFINYINNPSDPNSLSSYGVYSILEDNEGNLWVGTRGGGLNLAARSTNDNRLLTFKHYKHNPDDPTSISDNIIAKVLEDSTGLFWIGTVNRGINIFNRKKKSFAQYNYDPNDPMALSSNVIQSIYEDNSGIIWFGPQGGSGIHKFDRLKEQFNPYRNYLKKPKGLAIKDIFKIFEDKSGILWIGTQQGLYKIDRNSDLYKYYSHNPNDPKSLSANWASSICEDQLGNIWVGTVGGGLNKFDKEKEEFIHYRHNPNNPRSINDDITISLCIDSRNTIWVGTYDGGLNKFDIERNEFIHYKHNPEDPLSISGNRVSYIFEDSKGNLWLGTRDGGLNKFDREKEKFTSFKHDPNDSTSISINYINSIDEDHTGILWIGTDFGGLNRFDSEKGTFKSYGISDGLPSENIFGLLEDDKGNLWICTTDGLCKFNPTAGVIRIFDVADGLTDNKFNDEAHCKTKSGELLFGGNNGLTIFHPDSLIYNSHIPPVVITDFQLFNESVPIGFYEKMKRTILSNSITETSQFELTYEEKIFAIEFAALDFHAPEKNKYAYIMEGFEENWNYTDASRRFVTYTNLDPGEYTFRVKASNNHGVWNEKGASIKIIILPPWWATTWAYLAYALLLIGTIYFVWRMQLRRIKIKHDYEMSKFEAEKIHEVDEMKSKFFANISHEFRTPLTLIFGPAKDIEENCEDNKAKQSAGIIKRNASKLYTLVNQLLDISKLEAGKMKLEATEQNIIPLLKGYVLSFSSLAERKKIKLSFDTVEENLQAYIDKDKVEKIINNLLSNAFKFTPEEGKIDFAVEKLNKYAEIRITDNGIGIEKERLDKIFDRFYQVDGSHTREREGTGIGLSLTKELVELHKGKIEVESEYGKGTTFKVILPLGKEHLRPEEIVKKDFNEEKETTIKEIDQIPEIEYGKKTNDIDLLIETDLSTDKAGKPLLLIVEDNSDVRQYIISHLEDEYRILEAANGENGLPKALDHIPDLIISDVMMPKMDGFEMCNKLKTDERTSHIPIILLTAKATDKDKIAGYETGADDYIMKPFDSNVLKVRIKNLIDQRRKLREQFRKEGLIEIETREITSLDKKFLKNVIKVINKHLSDISFGVEMFAEELSMSRRNLDRKLGALTGESSGDLIRRARLTHAAKLIIQNFGNISEIALEVGFSNPSYFSKCFSEQFGLSPSEYKTNNSK